MGATGLGIYNAADISVEDPETRGRLRVFGAHFSDVCEGERLEQAEAVISAVETAGGPDTGSAVALAGDLNAMHGYSWQARLLRSRPVRRFAEAKAGPNLTPADFVRENHRIAKALRLSHMAEGKVIKRLMESTVNFRDADPLGRPTFSARWPVVQIDHIMISGAAGAHNYQVHNLKGSDHRPVSTVISL